MRVVAALVAAVVVALAPSVGSAQDLVPVTNRAEMNAFLALYQGTWQGRGDSRPTPSDEMEITRCVINSVFDSATASLRSAGDCANLRGTTPLDGALSVDPAGDLEGSFFSRSRGVEMVSSTGSIFTDRIVLDQVYRAEVDHQMRQFQLQVHISKPGASGYNMVAVMFDDATQTWGEVTRISFTPN